MTDAKEMTIERLLFGATRGVATVITISLVVIATLSFHSAAKAASPAQQTAPTPDADDSLIQALRKHYVGKGFEAAESEFESSGWKEADGDIGYQIFQKGELKIRVDYYPTGLGQITKITRLR